MALKNRDGKLPQDPGNEDCGRKRTGGHPAWGRIGRMDDVSGALPKLLTLE